MSNLRDRLREDTGEYPPSWRPEAGDVVSGELLRYSTAPSIYGEQKVCVIDDEEIGPVTVWLNSTVLLDEFKRLRPKVGETVGIKCHGKHPDKGYWRFRVDVDRGESPAEPDWDKIEAPDAAQVRAGRTERTASPARRHDDDDDGEDPLEGRR